MNPEPPRAIASDDTAQRAALAAEVRRLEDALRRAQRALTALGGERVPGLHLVVDVAGRRGLVSSARVSEVVRIVATRPLAGAPSHVLGTFVCRGVPVVAVDLAVLLGSGREPPLDAQIIVLAGTPAVGVVVDRVERLVDGPRLFEGDAVAATPEAWRGSPLVAGLCVEAGEVVPLLELSPVAASVGDGA